MTATLTTDKRQTTGDINSATKNRKKKKINKAKNVVISQGEKRKYYEQWPGATFGRLPSQANSQALQNLFWGKF